MKPVDAPSDDLPTRISARISNDLQGIIGIPSSINVVRIRGDTSREEENVVGFSGTSCPVWTDDEVRDVWNGNDVK